MDSGLFIAWVAEIALVAFVASMVLHFVLRRRAAWSILITALLPPMISIAIQLGRSYSSDMWPLVAAMVCAGVIGGLIGASTGAWLGINVRRFVAVFVE